MLKNINIVKNNMLRPSLAISQVSMVTVQMRNHRVTRPRHNLNWQYDEDVRARKVEVAKLRKKAKVDYWTQQTIVENRALEIHKNTRITKMQDDMDRWRTQICNISYTTEKKFDYLAERERNLMKKMQAADIKEGQRRLENQYKLDAMQIDSARWPTLKTMDALTTKYLLPQTVLNYTEYQLKL